MRNTTHSFVHLHTAISDRQRATVEAGSVGLVFRKATLTISEAATVLGVGETLMWRLVRQQTVRSFKLGGRRLIPESAIEELLAADVDRDSTGGTK